MLSSAMRVMSKNKFQLAEVLFFLVTLSACGTGKWHPEPSAANEKLRIELFWSDTGNSAQIGAAAAERTEKFQAIDKYVELHLRLDPDSSEEAVRVAREIRLDPRVIAVVGHTRSGTTRAALSFYADAGIPVLMPAATSPYALYRFNEHEPWPSVDQLGRDPAYPRYQNAFRLPPSDVPDQVDAIRVTAKKLAGTDKVESEDAIQQVAAKTKVMIICETTKRYGSDVYTKPMCDSLRKSQDPKFSPLIASYREIDLDTGDIWGLVTEIHAVQPKLIIFLGYPEFARDLLEELKERAPSGGKNGNPYKFILADASLTDDIAKFDADVYVTSPIDLTDSVRCGSEEARVLKNEVKMKNRQKEEPTDETYTFDAVLILAEAVKQCENTLDRHCIIQNLETNHNQLSGACQQYRIDRGERQNASYSVYSNCNGRLLPRWTVVKGGIHEDESWNCPTSNK
jgi:ABC-type branched-subunit amino acid transport system substrate-binding protein